MNIVALVIGALMIGSIYSVLAMGYCLIYKSTNLFNLAQGNFMMLGAYFGVTFFVYLKFPFAVAVFCTALVMFGIGYGLQSGLIRALLNRGAPVAYVILLTSALAQFTDYGSQFVWGVKELRFPSLFKKPFVTIFGGQVAPESLLVLGIASFAMIALYIFLNKTKFGTAVRAEAMDAAAASSMGINVPLVRGFCWGLSAALCGMIGVAIGPVFGVFLSMGSMYTPKGFQSAVVGGYGNIFGALLGGMFYGFVETFISAFITSQYKDAVSFAILLLVLTFMPRGFTNEPVIE